MRCEMQALLGTAVWQLPSLLQLRRHVSDVRTTIFSEIALEQLQHQNRQLRLVERLNKNKDKCCCRYICVVAFVQHVFLQFCKRPPRNELKVCCSEYVLFVAFVQKCVLHVCIYRCAFPYQLFKYVCRHDRIWILICLAGFDWLS